MFRQILYLISFFLMPLELSAKSTDHNVTDTIFKVSIHITELGTENTQSLLLVHGLGQNASLDWSKVAPEFAKSYHVILVDLPGFGKSGSTIASRYTPENYAAFLAWAVKIYAKSKVIVAGHSMGGAITLSFAHKYPDQVEKIILIDAAGILQRSIFVRHLSNVHPIYYSQIPGTGLLGKAAKAVNVISNRIIDFADQYSDFSDLVLKTPKLQEALAKNSTIASAAMGLIETNYTEALSTIQIPVLILWGENDPVAPLRTGELLNSMLKSSTLETFKNVGHVPMNEVPQLVLKKSLAWLESPTFTHFQAPEVTDRNYLCKNQKDKTIQGGYSVIRLENCENIQLKDVSTRYFELKESTAHIQRMQIESQELGLYIEDSVLEATNFQIKAKVGIKMIDSRLDLAGTSIKASQNALDYSGSNLVYWSVSRIDDPILGAKILHERKSY